MKHFLNMLNKEAANRGILATYENKMLSIFYPDSSAEFIMKREIPPWLITHPSIYSIQKFLDVIHERHLGSLKLKQIVLSEASFKEHLVLYVKNRADSCPDNVSYPVSGDVNLTLYMESIDGDEHLAIQPNRALLDRWRMSEREALETAMMNMENTWKLEFVFFNGIPPRENICSPVFSHDMVGKEIKEYIYNSDSFLLRRNNLPGGSSAIYLPNILTEISEVWKDRIIYVFLSESEVCINRYSNNSMIQKLQALSAIVDEHTPYGNVSNNVFSYTSGKHYAIT